MGPGVSQSVSQWCFVDLTDVSLVDEDTNSILADETNRQSQDQIWIWCKWCHLEATFCNLCKWLLLVAKFQDFNQTSGFWPNIRIYTKFKDFNPISGAQPNFRILTKFQDFNQISEFQPNFRISTKFHGFYQILGFSPNFRITTKFQDFNQIS